MLHYDRLDRIIEVLNNLSSNSEFRSLFDGFSETDI